MENFGKTIFVIIVMIICFLILFSAEEDKYIIRDGCIYHKTKEWTGDGFSINRTKVTCDKLQFKKYKIEKD